MRNSAAFLDGKTLFSLQFASVFFETSFDVITVNHVSRVAHDLPADAAKNVQRKRREKLTKTIEERQLFSRTKTLLVEDFSVSTIQVKMKKPWKRSLRSIDLRMEN